MNNTNDMYKEMRLAQIEEEIKEAESEKGAACIMMVVSFFFLWPLLIVGIIQYNNANKKIEELNEEKKNIMLQEYFDGNKQW